MRHACCTESRANGIVGDPAPETLTAPSGIRPCTHKSRLVGGGWSMSALPAEADIRQRIEHACFVPKPELGFVAFHDVWVRR